MTQALLAGFWGLRRGAALLVGALLGLYAGASQRIISIVMAVGTGVLISSVAFDLMDETYEAGGFDVASGELLLGAMAFFVADRVVNKTGGRHRKRS